MKRIWKISIETWLDTIRPMAIWTLMYIAISYLSNSYREESIYLIVLALIITTAVGFGLCCVFITPIHDQIYNNQQKTINDLKKELDKLNK